jgi:C-terminal processing protease CtpA/Prc
LCSKPCAAAQARIAYRASRGRVDRNEVGGASHGDRITAIDGRSAAAISLKQITDLIRAQPATYAKLEIERETQRRELNVGRRAVVVEAD